MVSPEKFISTLQNCGVNFFAGVPDSLLKNVCAYITDHFDSEHNLITANEGNAVGVAAGHYLATGEIPLVYMQNSGIGNAVNPLLSLADEKVYSMPILLMIGWRGEPGVHDEPQHVKQGAVTLSLLDTMDIPYIILSNDEKETESELKGIVDKCRAEKRPCAIIIKKDTFGKYKLKQEANNNYPVSREKALKIVVNNMPENSVIVSTTGKLSRELYEYRDETGISHETDFLTVGSMGHSSSIALGIALAKSDRKVFCFDGDGAFIMHMGSLTNIGNLKPKNYYHILFNNGAHESVGGQPTLGFNINVEQIALACGYKKVISAANEEEIIEASKSPSNDEGPILIELKVGVDSRDNLGRPKSSPIENKTAFMHYLQK